MRIILLTAAVLGSVAGFYFGSSELLACSCVPLVIGLFLLDPKDGPFYLYKE